MNGWRIGLAAVALGLATPAFAAAQDEGQAPDGGSGRREIRFDLHADVTWYAAVGVGGRIDLTIVPEGLLDGVDDDLAISPGVELFYFWRHHDGLALWPLLAFQWNFYLSERWSIFPEVGVVFLLLQEARNRERYWKSVVAPFGGFGARWSFNARNALLLRVSWPAGFQVGLIF